MSSGNATPAAVQINKLNDKNNADASPCFVDVAVQDAQNGIIGNALDDVQLLQQQQPPPQLPYGRPQTHRSRC